MNVSGLVRALARPLVAVLLLLALVPGSVSAGGLPTLKITRDTLLTADFAGYVVIVRNGVTLDCAGHQVTGNGNGRGITVDQKAGVTVRNCDVSNFATGFWVASATTSTFEANRSHDNVPGAGGATLGAGFWMQGSSNNTIRANQIYDNQYDGLDAFMSSNNLFVDNAFTGNGSAATFFGKGSASNTLVTNLAELNGWDGFHIADGASDTTLVSNVARGNAGCGFSVDGNTSPSNGNVMDANSATENGCGFLVNRDATDNLLTNNTATGNIDIGFIVAEGAYGNRLADNVAGGNAHGFVLYLASANELTGNSATANAGYGFAVVSSTDNDINHNMGCGNGLDALQDAASTGNTWTDNTFCTSDGI